MKKGEKKFGRECKITLVEQRKLALYAYAVPKLWRRDL